MFDATETITGDLDSIAGSADDVAESLTTAGSAAEGFTEAIDEAEDEANAFVDSLGDVVDVAAQATAGIEAVEAATESATDAFEDGTTDVLGYGTALDSLTDDALDVITTQKGVAESIDDVGDQAVESAAEVLTYTGALGALAGMDVGGDGDERGSGRGVGGIGGVDTPEVSGISLPDLSALSIATDVEDTDMSGISVRDKTFTVSAVTEGFGEAISQATTLLTTLRALDGTTVEAEADVDVDRQVAMGPGRLGRSTTNTLDPPDIGSLASALPSKLFGGGSGGDGFEMAFSLPDIPSLDLSSITETATGAASALTEVGGALGDLLGMSQQVAGIGRLAGALGSVGSAATAATAALGGFAILGTLAGSVVALTGAVGGLVTAFAGLGGALASVVGVGLFKKGQEIAAQSKEIESAWQGAQKWLSSFADEAKAALQPIMQLPTGDFLGGLIQGGLSALRDWSSLVSQVWPSISGMFDRLGQVWSANQPEFFAQLEGTIEAFLPMIEGFVAWFLRSAPEAIGFMRQMGTQLLPDVVEMFSALWGAIEPFIPAGAAAASIGMDLVTFLAELVTPISEILGFALTPTFQGLAWVMDKLAAGTKWLSDAFSSLMDSVNRWVGAIWSAATNLNAAKISKLLSNLVLMTFEALANAVGSGITSLYKTTISLIKKIPGASTAFKAWNALRGAKGKGKVKGALDMPNADLSGAMADLNPRKKGKQTSPVPVPGPGGATTTTYRGGDFAPKIEVTGKSRTEARGIASLVRTELGRLQREQRQRSYATN